MPKEAVLINVARGQHVDDDALLAALDEGMLDYAYLDVFRQEPLPATHSFWHHPKIRVTPHISAVTNVDTAVEQIVANYHRIKQKTPMLNTIDPERGY